MADAPNVNARTVQRIEASILFSDSEDERKLLYIKQQLSPAGLARRGEDDQDVKHLREVADAILKPIEREASHD